MAKFNGDLSENLNPNFNKTASTGLGDENQSMGGATPPLINKPEQTEQTTTALTTIELELDDLLN